VRDHIRAAAVADDIRESNSVGNSASLVVADDIRESNSVGNSASWVVSYRKAGQMRRLGPLLPLLLPTTILETEVETVPGIP